MKIAIIKPTETISPTNGVKVQCEMWKRGLEECGHEVTLISDWSSQNWKEFDCILFVQFGGILRGLANALYCINPNLAIAPIIDTNFSNLQFKLLCKYYGSCRLKLSNIFHDFYKVRNMFKLYLVRSKYEKLYVTRSFGHSGGKGEDCPSALQGGATHSDTRKGELLLSCQSAGRQAEECGETHLCRTEI